MISSVVELFGITGLKLQGKYTIEMPAYEKGSKRGLLLEF